MKKFGIQALACVVASISINALAETRPPVLKVIEANGVTNLKEFKVGDDLRGFAGVSGQEPIAVYVGKDGNAIVGTRINAAGETIDVKKVEELVRKPFGESAWKTLESAQWIRDGKANAPRIIYVITDPNCPWCHKLWAAARPWVASGKVQLRHLLVGIIRSDSEAKAAAILTAANPLEAFERNETSFDKGGIVALKTVPSSAKQTLQSNVKLMTDLGFRGTPAIVYRTPEGDVEFIGGFPQPAQMQKLFGPR
ncbi:thiol:disulfide interchange protein DsbG [Comamonas testosteroni]|uniref:thiol:disulfide interchange protein DsbG n=1 Tax=Comamonas testosteroni TaxID=285 RepID=UPI0026EAAEC1|nr:thiol:disulfide interchange protein DsbG [Comamonas testosteroni]